MVHPEINTNVVKRTLLPFIDSVSLEFLQSIFLLFNVFTLMKVKPMVLYSVLVPSEALHMSIPCLSVVPLFVQDS